MQRTDQKIRDELLCPLLHKMKRPEVKIRMPRLVSACPPGSANLRLALVILSIGAASHFLLFLDSVVDNLLPAAMPFLMTVYNDKADAALAWELMVSSRIYGLAFGCFISILLSNRSGRKFPVLLGTTLDVIGVLFTLLTVYLPMGIAAAIIGRFINGCGQGIVQTAGSVMLAEIPPMKRRGTALATLTMWACMGELLGMFISLDDLLGQPSTWHWAMAIPLIPLLPALYILCRAPESPRYLYMVNREIEAHKAMLFYQSPADAKQSTEEIMSEMKFISSDVDENGNSTRKAKEQQSTLCEAFGRLQDGHFTRPLLIAIFVQAFVHLDDWLWISYSTPIFATYGLSNGQAQKASLLMSIPQAIISVALLGCFDNFSRRSLLIIPTFVSACIGMLAIGFISYGTAIVGGLSVAVLLPVLASVDLASAAISGESAFAIVPELFLPNDKIIGTAIVGISQNVFGGILTTFLLTAVNRIGTGNVLIPFVLMNILYVIVNYKYLPETGEKTPQEVSRNFSSDLPGAHFFARLRSFFNSIFHFVFPSRLVSRSLLVQITVFIFQAAVFFVLLHISYHFYILMVA